eukprot:404154_1
MQTFPVKMLNKNSKLIIICRNSKDCAVSYYYFCKKLNIKRDEWMYEWDVCIDQFISGSVGIGYFSLNSYWSFYKDYYDLYNAPNSQFYRNNVDAKMLWIYYEDLIKNPKDQIIKIAKFLDQYQNFNDKENTIQQIIKESSFNEMNEKSGRNTNKFFRKGNVNDWKNHLTSQQNNDINQLTRDYFDGTDFKYLAKRWI